VGKDLYQLGPNPAKRNRLQVTGDISKAMRDEPSVIIIKQQSTAPARGRLTRAKGVEEGEGGGGEGGRGANNPEPGAHVA
jgi:hypothetical protein